MDSLDSLADDACEEAKVRTGGGASDPASPTVRSSIERPIAEGQTAEPGSPHAGSLRPRAVFHAGIATASRKGSISPDRISAAPTSRCHLEQALAGVALADEQRARHKRRSNVPSNAPSNVLSNVPSTEDTTRSYRQSAKGGSQAQEPGSRQRNIEDTARSNGPSNVPSNVRSARCDDELARRQHHRSAVERGGEQLVVVGDGGPKAGYTYP